MDFALSDPELVEGESKGEVRDSEVRKKAAYITI